MSRWQHSCAPTGWLSLRVSLSVDDPVVDRRQLALEHQRQIFGPCKEICLLLERVLPLIGSVNDDARYPS